jgi:hypothetical protein
MDSLAVAVPASEIGDSRIEGHGADWKKRSGKIAWRFGGKPGICGWLPIWSSRKPSWGDSGTAKRPSSCCIF